MKGRVFHFSQPPHSQAGLAWGVGELRPPAGQGLGVTAQGHLGRGWWAGRAGRWVRETEIGLEGLLGATSLGMTGRVTVILLPRDNKSINDFSP